MALSEDFIRRLSAQQGATSPGLGTSCVGFGDHGHDTCCNMPDATCACDMVMMAESPMVVVVQ